MYAAPPEINERNSEAYSYAGDVWSLGCCFYELLALRRPFNGNGLMELAQNILHEKPPDLPNVYSEALRSLVRCVGARECVACMARLRFS